MEDINEFYSGSTSLLNLLDNILSQYEQNNVRYFIVRPDHSKKLLHLTDFHYLDNNSSFMYDYENFHRFYYNLQQPFILLFNVDLFGVKWLLFNVFTENQSMDERRSQFLAAKSMAMLFGPILIDRFINDALCMHLDVIQFMSIIFSTMNKMETLLNDLKLSLNDKSLMAVSVNNLKMNNSLFGFHFDCLMKKHTKKFLEMYAAGKYLMVNMLYDPNLIYLTAYCKIPYSDMKQYIWREHRADRFVKIKPVPGFVLVYFPHQSPLDGQPMDSYILFLYLPEQRMHLRKYFIYEANQENFIELINNLIQPNNLHVFRVDDLDSLTVGNIFKLLYQKIPKESCVLF